MNKNRILIGDEKSKQRLHLTQAIQRKQKTHHSTVCAITNTKPFLFSPFTNLQAVHIFTETTKRLSYMPTSLNASTAKGVSLPSSPF